MTNPAMRFRISSTGLCACGLAALLMLRFLLRTGWAAWLVFPSQLAIAPPVGIDVEVLRQAARLAPGEASYAAFEAQFEMTASRARGLPAAAAVDVMDRAYSSAERAHRLAPTSAPYARLVGSAALRYAELVAAEDQATWVEAGRHALESATRLAPNSPRIHQEAGLELVRVWPALEPEAQEFALRALRRGATLDPSQLDLTSSVLRARLPERLWATYLVQATPPTPAAMARLGSILEDAHAARALPELKTAALAAFEQAAESSDLRLTLVDDWTRAVARLTPDREERQRLATRFAARNAARAEGYLPLIDLCQTQGCRSAAFEDAIGLVETGVVSRVAGSRRPDIVVRERYGRHLAATGSCELAIPVLETVASAEPQNPTPRLAQAACYRSLGREDERVRTLQDAAGRAPRNNEVRARLADAYFDNSDYLGAIDEWRRLARQSPTSVAPRLSIARAYATMGLRDQALRAYAEVLEIEPEHAAARAAMTRMLSAQ
jgi:tetratricopeptide (TPR) repeat protein